MRKAWLMIAGGTVLLTALACGSDSSGPAAKGRTLSISSIPRQIPPPTAADFIAAFDLAYGAGARGQLITATWKELEPTAGRPVASLTSNLRGDSKDTVWRQLGCRLQKVENSADISRAFPQLHGGLKLTEVRPESAASRAGLKSGDILVGLHQWEMTTQENVLYVLNHADRATFSPLRFFIIRAGQVHRGLLTPTE